MIPDGIDHDLRYSIELQSLSVCRIKSLFKDMKILSGTGFFVRFENHSIGLATCWHVLTCRDPKNPQATLKNTQTSPESIEISYIKTDLSINKIKISLYDSNQNPVWLQRQVNPLASDTAMLDLSIEKLDCFAINDNLQNEFRLDNINLPRIDKKDPLSQLRISADVFVLGFPNIGNDHETHLPIWKHGNVASEPRLTNPSFLIDATTNSGFSGSPVLCDTSKLNRIIKVSRKLPLDLIGIYSSHLEAEGYDPSIGVVWKMNSAPWIGCPSGFNPYPPILT